MMRVGHTFHTGDTFHMNYKLYIDLPSTKLSAGCMDAVSKAASTVDP